MIRLASTCTVDPQYIEGYRNGMWIVQPDVCRRMFAARCLPSGVNCIYYGFFDYGFKGTNVRDFLLPAGSLLFSQSLAASILVNPLTDKPALIAVSS